MQLIRKSFFALATGFIFSSALVSKLGHAETEGAALSPEEEAQSPSFRRDHYIEGFEPSLLSKFIQRKKGILLGAEDVRMVLGGTLYRGGANDGSQKPLATRTLERMCQLGFSEVVYLYSANFRGPFDVDCTTFAGQPNRLHYRSQTFDKLNDQYKILEVVHASMTANRGPVYVHCWNGWHAAGLVGAIALQQFCEWSPEESLSYWKKNIPDPQNISKKSGVLRRIKNYVPREDLKISPELQKQICPQKTGN